MASKIITNIKTNDVATIAAAQRDRRASPREIDGGQVVLPQQKAMEGTIVVRPDHVATIVDAVNQGLSTTEDIDAGIAVLVQQKSVKEWIVWW